MSLTLQDRVDSYKAAFPDYPDSWPWVSPTGRWLSNACSHLVHSLAPNSHPASPWNC